MIRKLKSGEYRLYSRKPDPKTAGGQTKDNEAHESIADIASAQGGLASLGGAGNRETSTGTESAMTGPLRAEYIEKRNPVKLDGVLKEGEFQAARAGIDYKNRQCMSS